MIAGKTESEIVAMPSSSRSRWYKTILPEEKEKAIKIMKIVGQDKLNAYWTAERRAEFGAAQMGEKNPSYGGLSEKHKVNLRKSWTSERRTEMREINTGERNPFFGKTHTEETRYKMSESNSGKNHHMYGKNHSEETCIKMSESKMGENNPNFGKSFTEETRDRMSAAWTPERRRERSIEMSETRIGGNNPNWRGGSSFEPYGLEFNNDLREQIRNRDNYICQGCNKTQEELGRKLNVHHIDYDKTNNKPENLICLCSSCHSKTNFDRENWIQYFRKLIGDL